jgi:hypothetical protein
LGVIFSLALAGQAVAAAERGYADSVDQALQTARQAPEGDGPAARRAADQLEAGTGQSQPEILGELRAEPPDLAEARVRLAALSRSARSPAFTPEPGRARAAIHDILSQPRYAGLQAGPSLGDRVTYLALQLLVRVLERLGRGGLPLLWALAVAGAGGLVAVVVLLMLGARGRGRREARLAVPPRTEVARDRFAEADRLAAGGDLTAAVRALAGAVAAALGEERDWDRSPLTVREVFARAREPGALRPLLVVFEAAVYGARPPDAEAYTRAARAAAAFRPPAEALAA